MNKLQADPLLPEVQATGFRNQLYRLLRETFLAINRLIEDTNTLAVTAPTTGTHLKGDRVFNASPAELGTAGNKYILTHWTCTASGTPGTWLECRSLTGN